MAARREVNLDAFVVQVEGLDLEKNKVGSGAYGCVFRVTVNGKDCIAKKLHKILLQEQSLGQRQNIVTKFHTECCILSDLDHPNVVGFIGVHYGRDSDDISLIMEKLHSDLANFVETHPGTNIAIKIHILYEVSKGLRYLHSLIPPLIHRDLTAPNVLLTEDLTAKIGDLGVSRYVDLERLTHVLTNTPGNASYMPPECHDEYPIYTTKLDIFSFGHLIIHTVIGDFPKVYNVSRTDCNYFKYINEGKEELMRRNTAVHGEKMGEKHILYPLVVSCLHDRPPQRPSVDEVIDSLRKLCLKCPRMSFLEACKTGNVGLVQELLECGADPNQADKNGITVVHWASRNGHDEVVRVHIQLKSGATPLWTASFYGHYKCVKLLIDARANVNAPKKDGATALIVAAENGHLKVVELLIAAMALVDTQQKDGWTALHWASQNGHCGVVRMLLEAKADINIKANNNQRALHRASANGHYEVVRVLLAAKATVNTQDKSGETPFWVASFNGQQKCVELLIDAGASVDVPNKDGATALYVAAQNGHCRVVRMLLKAKADVNIKTIDNQTLLYRASANGHDEVVKALLAAKATVNTQNKSGETPLWLASFYGYHKCVELLIDAGANVDVPKENGTTALFVAAQNHHLKAIELLIVANAQVDIQNKDGWTALHMASQNGHCGVVRMLLEAKADVNVKTNTGHTAYDAALWHRRTKVCGLLLQGL